MRVACLLPLLAALGAAACGSRSADGSSNGETIAVLPPRADGGACVNAPESTQRHGAPCLCCHSDEFGVAGSVALSGPPVARVVVTGPDGDVADMHVNSFGNFFRHFPLATPVAAVAYGPDGRSIAMRELAPIADCNMCHGTGGSVGPIVGP